MNRSLIRVLVFCLVLLAVMPAAAQDEQTLRFTFWIPLDHPAAVEVYQPLAEAYMEENPGVTIEYSFIPFNEYSTAIATQLSGSTPPDAGWIVERMAPQFIAAGTLYDMGETLRADEAYDYADFAEPAMGLWLRDEAVYGIPFSTSPIVTIFNRTLFDEAGLEAPDVLAERGEWTWEALAEASRTISAETDNAGFVGLDGVLYTSSGNAWGTLVPLLRAYGTDVFTSDGACTMNSPEAVEAISLLNTMIFEDQSVVPPGSETAFWGGEVGVTLGQISRLTNLDNAEFEWGITAMPGGPAGDVAAIGQAGMVVFSGANNQNQELAADFVKYLTSQTGVAGMAPFFPPARQSVLESDTFLNSNSRVSPEDMAGVVAPAIANGVILTSHPNFAQIELLGATALDQLWMPGADVQATLDQYCQLITPSLSQ